MAASTRGLKRAGRRALLDHDGGRRHQSQCGRFSDEETIWAAAAVLRRWIEQYGVPLALYTDWKNVYVRAGDRGGAGRRGRCR